jgi:ABC-type polysaccharide/polyol phosphate export permease
MASPPETGSALGTDGVAADARAPQIGARHRTGVRAQRLRHELDVLVALTESDLRARYGRGPLRMVKWLLDPFAAVGVYLVLTTFVLDRPGVAPGLSIACAVVPFQLVMSSIVNGLGAVSLRRSIILNMSFERSIIPLSAVLTETIAFAASLLLLVLMMAAYSIAPTVAVLWLPVVLLSVILLAVACAYLFSLLGLWFRELRVFFVSFVRTMFFLAAGLIPLAAITGRANDLVKLNPLTGLFESFRDVLLYGQRPAAWEILYPMGFAVVILLVVLPLYRLEQRDFAKVVE